MSQISVNDLTFGYEGSFDNIFENISFSIDTGWKLGFIGRNGKGKTTFLNLLEKLIEEYHPTMLIVEHDVRFREKLADKVVEL